MFFETMWVIGGILWIFLAGFPAERDVRLFEMLLQPGWAFSRSRSTGGPPRDFGGVTAFTKTLKSFHHMKVQKYRIHSNLTRRRL
ncbi:hypothetical protein TNCV_4968731 [Trichonephila clavipes]|nr:hypothetical protein TNCV_4968731 [Trichonephila clavipes]